MLMQSFQLLTLQDTLFGEISEKIYTAFIKEDRYVRLLEGLGNTVKITLLALLIGVILGLITGVLRIRRIPVLTSLCNTYVSIIRGTPSTIQLVIIYFVIFANVNMTGWITAAIAFGINSGAYVSEIVRGGILGVDKGQMEAARTLGLSYFGAMRHVIVPQSVKNILPALGNEVIVLLKETSIAGYISVYDLTFAAKSINASSYEYFAPMLLAAYTYLIMTMMLSKGLAIYERRLRTSD